MIWSNRTRHVIGIGKLWMRGFKISKMGGRHLWMTPKEINKTFILFASQRFQHRRAFSELYIFTSM